MGQSYTSWEGLRCVDGPLIQKILLRFVFLPQNFNLGFNQTVTDFESFPNKYVSSPCCSFPLVSSTNYQQELM